MLDWLKHRTGLKRSAAELYGRIVAQSRQPALYRTYGVPDTMDGRLEMILLHVVLVLDRLKRDGAPGQRLGQRLMESLVADLDDALRRIGIGDDGVAGRMPRLAGALSERARDYGLALGDAPSLPSAPAAGTTTSVPDDALAAALLEHVYRPQAEGSHAPPVDRLAAYVREVRRTLSESSSAILLAGRVDFPELTG